MENNTTSATEAMPGALLEATAKITNDTNLVMRLKSAEHGHAPSTIGAHQTGQSSGESHWSNLTNALVYTFDGVPGYEVELYWDVQTFGSNIYTAAVTPNDGRFSVSHNKPSGYHVKINFTVSENR